MDKGNLRNELIDQSQTSFPLKGKINPTFQNEGTDSVYILGRKVMSGESYSVNVPNVVLQNDIAITFENAPNTTKILYVGYVELKS